MKRGKNKRGQNACVITTFSADLKMNLEPIHVLLIPLLVLLHSLLSVWGHCANANSTRLATIIDTAPYYTTIKLKYDNCRT